MRLSLVISSLSAGGAERILSLLASAWADAGHHVTLITLAGAGQDFYTYAPEVERIALAETGNSKSARQAAVSNLRRIWRLRRALGQSKPDVVVSFTDVTNVLTLLAMRGRRTPVIVSERVDPRFHSIGRLWSALRAFTYRSSAAIVVQTKSVECWAEAIRGSSRVRVIANPVLPPGLPAGAGMILSAPCILAMGRLARQKGFDLLIRAFAQCAAACPEWSLVILGEGSQRLELERLATALGVHDRVQMPGRTKQPAQALRQASIFVLSSRYEGFPNALLEAMACGLPVISTDCPSGPTDIIEDGANGLLVPTENSDALAGAMQRLMLSESERHALGNSALDVLRKYSISSVLECWQGVFDEVTAPGS